MNIKRIAIEKLKPALYNPRKDLKTGDPEYEKLKTSIDEFGFIEPIVWNETTGNVISGHQRLKVLKDRGEKEVDVVIVDFDKKKEKLANIALNKISGDWEFTMLADLLQELDAGDLDITISGFDLPELENIALWNKPLPENIPDVDLKGEHLPNNNYLVIIFNDKESFLKIRDKLSLSKMQRSVYFNEFIEKINAPTS